MKWLKKIYLAYMNGYQANRFPFNKYGFLGEKMKRK